MHPLSRYPNTDVVLLDSMMPEIDGYEGDREKAIAAGASDYITKPVDLDHHIAMMRV